jgi:hypothetical protein
MTVSDIDLLLSIALLSLCIAHIDDWQRFQVMSSQGGPESESFRFTR